MKNEKCNIHKAYRYDCKYCPLTSDCFGVCEVCGMPLFSGSSTAVTIGDDNFICESCIRNMDPGKLKQVLIQIAFGE